MNLAEAVRQPRQRPTRTQAWSTSRLIERLPLRVCDASANASYQQLCQRIGRDTVPYCARRTSAKPPLAAGRSPYRSKSYGRVIFTLLQLGEDANFRNPAKSGSCSISEGMTG